MEIELDSVIELVPLSRVSVTDVTLEYKGRDAGIGLSLGGFAQGRVLLRDSDKSTGLMRNASPTGNHNLVLSTSLMVPNAFTTLIANGLSEGQILTTLINLGLLVNLGGLVK